MVLIPLFCSFCKYCIFVSVILNNIDAHYSNNGAIIALYTTSHIKCQIHANHEISLVLNLFSSQDNLHMLWNSGFYLL